MYNGQITGESTFGEDPSEQHEDLKVRRKIKFDTNFDVSMLYSTAVIQQTFQRRFNVAFRLI